MTARTQPAPRPCPAAGPWTFDLPAGLGPRSVAAAVFCGAKNAGVPLLGSVTAHVVYAPPSSWPDWSGEQIAAAVAPEIAKGLYVAHVIASRADLLTVTGEISAATRPMGRLRIVISESAPIGDAA